MAYCLNISHPLKYLALRKLPFLSSKPCLGTGLQKISHTTHRYCVVGNIKHKFIEWSFYLGQLVKINYSYLEVGREQKLGDIHLFNWTNEKINWIVTRKMDKCYRQLKGGTDWCLLGMTQRNMKIIISAGFYLTYTRNGDEEDIQPNIKKISGEEV